MVYVYFSVAQVWESAKNAAAFLGGEHRCTMLVLLKSPMDFSLSSRLHAQASILDRTKRPKIM